LTRRRLLAGGGGLIAAAALGRTGYDLGRRTPKAPAPAVPAPTQLWRYATRADLPVPVVSLTATGANADGLIFLTPAAGAGGRGPLIVDNSGAPVWFRQVAGPAAVAIDARVQRLNGEPVLTWWEGTIDKLGVGSGEFVIADTSYREVKRLRAPGDLPTDQHDFILTEEGTALFFVCEPVSADLSSVGGAADGAIYDAVIYEVDVASGRTVLQWRARDHVELTESHAPAPTGASAHTAYDFFHANAVAVDHDGHLLVSSRHTWAVYKLDRSSGAVQWRLGGKRTDFTFGPGAAFSWQHDIRRRGDGTISVFDNGAGMTDEAKQSRGLILAIDESARTATLVRELLHPQPLLAHTQGNLQELAGGASFVGWGQEPYFTEHGPDGAVRVAGQLPSDNVSYRAYRFPWTAKPVDRPAVAATSASGNAVTVYASWNGATDVASWQVRGGAQPDRLTVVGEADRTGFETAVTVRGPIAFVAVDALDASRQSLGSSTVMTVPPPAGA
jgi:hypothetical protein